MRKHLITTALLLFAGTSVWSQQQLSLKECVDLALRKNPEMNSLYLQSQIAKIDYASARYSQLPSLSAGVNHGYNFGRSIDRFSNQFVNRRIQSDYFSLSANWVIYGGMQTRNTIRQQHFNYLAGLKDQEAGRNRITMNVVSAYLSLLMSKAVAQSLQSQVDATEKQVARTVQLAKAGAVDIGVLLGLESQLAQEKLSLVEAENQIKLGRITLQNLMIQAPQNWDILPPTEAFLKGRDKLHYVAEEVFENAKKNMPELQSSALRVQGAEAMIAMAKGMRAPTIALYANMSTVFSENALELTNLVPTGFQTIGLTQNTNEPVVQPTFRAETRVIPFSSQMQNNFGQTLGISMSWNIFNGFAVQNNVQKSALNASIQQNAYIQSENALRASVYKAVADYDASRARFAAAGAALKAAQAQFNFAEKRFENGLSNIVDYTAAKNQKIRAEISFLQAEYERSFNLLVVAFYNGSEMHLDN